MRSIRLTLLLVIALLPALAAARAWKGITPGASTQQEVVDRFGEPTTKTKRTGRTILAYYGEQALEGTRQAQFHVDPSGAVLEITIFLTAQLDMDSVEGTYGKPPQRTFVEDTFQKVWVYPQSGVTVYFAKDGNVEALTFGPGTKAQAKPAAAQEGAAAPAREAQASGAK
jgi:outer membrane protein assembly factor BamE (lipoprotein component of BamABCDE complex)